MGDFAMGSFDCARRSPGSGVGADENLVFVLTPPVSRSFSSRYNWGEGGSLGRRSETEKDERVECSALLSYGCQDGTAGMGKERPCGFTAAAWPAAPFAGRGLRSLTVDFSGGRASVTETVLASTSVGQGFVRGVAK